MNDPRLNLGLYTKLSPKFIVTSQMKQSLSILQMPITELAQEISLYIEDNPVLELTELAEDDFSEPAAESTDEETSQADSLLEDLNKPEWDEYINEGNSNDLSFTPLTENEQLDYEQYVAADVSLSDHLLFQLKTKKLTSKQIEIGEFIIGNLSEDGYFRQEITEIADLCSVNTESVIEVLRIVKEFDPAGIASESLAECVLAQLPLVGATEGECEQIRELLDNYSSELSTFRYDEIEKKTGLDRDNLNDLLIFIKRTDPTPGLSFSSGENRLIVPDVFIVKNEDGFDVLLNEADLPPIRMNNYYLKIFKDVSVDSSTREYLGEKIKNAIWVLKSLQKRRKAIYKVTRAIVDAQKEYLTKGEAYLKPLRLRDIADVTELHESTVSRVTSGKYALSDHGLLELKSFFSKGLDTQEGDISTRKIKSLIRSFVSAESPETPYSDEKIVKLLSRQGVAIARRTVAKYRDELNIPTMSQRKRMRR